mmetsp:Transcript_33774/g.90148  ORF Transcript_33774/g.90148 Transcript_33774/m.90148 type:complete len:149 (-) Transcript_33774:163-609(-)
MTLYWMCCCTEDHSVNAKTVCASDMGDSSVRSELLRHSDDVGAEVDVEVEEEQEEEDVEINQEFLVLVQKHSVNQNTGLEIRQRTKSIEIHGVQEGPIAEWNRAHPVRAVKRGDVLVAVNGVRGPTSVELVDAFKSGMTLQLTFIRKS